MAAFSVRHSWAKPLTMGFMGATTHTSWSAFIAAFESRLRNQGWVNGHNIDIDYRWAEGRDNGYAKVAKDFVRRKVDIIVATGTPAALAAKKATKKIPIVFAVVGDPVGTKLVTSLAHPGGNITGLSNGQTNLAGRRLDELRRAIPGLKRLALIGNPNNHVIKLEMAAVQKRARKLKINVITRNIKNAAQIAPVMKSLKGEADAIYVCADPLLTHHRGHINILAASLKLPTMHAFRSYTNSGGLLSYGPDFRYNFERAAGLADRILRGTKPGSIPVEQNMKSKLVVNLNTAKALGLKIPKSVLRRADVIK
jgi:putative tryptophan/tyrosine transport system substrate-binding protein